MQLNDLERSIKVENVTNPTEEDLASEKEKNFFTYNRDYLAVPSSAINPFFEHYDRINICVNRG